jgi:hypothetical protein
MKETRSMQAINLADKLAAFPGCWQPRVDAATAAARREA